MWELDHKESWAPKSWCFWAVVLEKTLESPLGFKEIKSIYPKGSQSWIFIRRTDDEAETPIPWLPDVKNWLIWKGRDAGKDWGQEEKGRTEDEMAGWHYWLDGLKFEQASRVGDRQGSLACCSPWGHKESDMTERLNWTVLGHCCYTRAFSSCRKWGLLSSFSEQASHCCGFSCWASPVAQLVKNPLASAEDARDAGSILGWEDPLEKEMQPTPVFLPEKFHG